MEAPNAMAIGECRDCILNCDETSWKLHRVNILTWARCGSENVRINIHGDEKECITVL